MSEKNHRCVWCDTVYTNSAEFIEHMKEHMNDSLKPPEARENVKREPPDRAESDSGEPQASDSERHEEHASSGTEDYEHSPKPQLTIDEGPADTVEEQVEEQDPPPPKRSRRKGTSRRIPPEAIESDDDVQQTFNADGNDLSDSDLGEPKRRKRKQRMASRRCRICSKVCATAAGLTKHIRTHSDLMGELPEEGAKHKCPVCNKWFKTLLQLQQHMKTHNPDETYKCDNCGEAFVEKTMMSKHLKYGCARNLRSRRVRTARDAEESGEEEEAVCPLCDETFDSKVKLIEHMDTHSEEKKFQCLFCLHFFKDEDALEHHVEVCKSNVPDFTEDNSDSIDPNPFINMLPPVDDMFRCPSCKSTFTKHEDYLEHKVTHLTRTEASMVPTAPAYPNGIPNLEGHLAPEAPRAPADPQFFPENSANEGEDSASPPKEEGRVYPCPACDKIFEEKPNLHRHYTQNHCRQKIYRCPCCRRHLISYKSLARHLQTTCRNKARSKNPDISWIITGDAARVVNMIPPSGPKKSRKRFEIHKCPSCFKVFQSSRGYDAHAKCCQPDHPMRPPSPPPSKKRRQAKRRTSTKQNGEHDAYSSGGEADLTGDESHCKTCGKLFTNDDELNEHIALFATKPEMACTICHRIFASYESLRNHNKRYHKANHVMQYCPICEKGYTSYPDLMRHCESSDCSRTSEPVTCKTCNEEVQFEEYISHIRAHEGLETYSCPMCFKMYASILPWEKHKRTCSILMKSMGYEVPEALALDQPEEKTAESAGETNEDGDTQGESAENEINIRSGEEILADGTRAQIIYPGMRTTCIPKPAKPETEIIQDIPVPNPLTQPKKGRGYGKNSHHVYLGEGTAPSSLSPVPVGGQAGNDSMMCPVPGCGVICIGKYHIERHVKVVHEDADRVKCEICHKMYSNKHNLAVHLQSHKKERNYKCTYCNHYYPSKASLKVHVRRHTGERPYVCPVCSEAHYTPSELNKHVKKHGVVNPYPCPECDESFSAKKFLVYHLKTHRTPKEKQTYLCSVCGKSLKSKIAAEDHMANHTGERPHECPYCHKTFTWKGCLHRHLAQHTGKLHSCTLCEKSYWDKAGLREHMRTHTGERPFTCHICGKGFCNRRTWNQHLRVHGEKKHVCKVCGNKFSEVGYLNRHMKIHGDPSSRSESHTCSVCGQRFHSHALMMKHMHIHQNQQSQQQQQQQPQPQPPAQPPAPQQPGPVGPAQHPPQQQPPPQHQPLPVAAAALPEEHPEAPPVPPHTQPQPVPMERHHELLVDATATYKPDLRELERVKETPVSMSMEIPRYDRLPNLGYDRADLLVERHRLPPSFEKQVVNQEFERLLAAQRYDGGTQALERATMERIQQAYERPAHRETPSMEQHPAIQGYGRETPGMERPTALPTYGRETPNMERPAHMPSYDREAVATIERYDREPTPALDRNAGIPGFDRDPSALERATGMPGYDRSGHRDTPGLERQAPGLPGYDRSGIRDPGVLERHLGITGYERPGARDTPELARHMPMSVYEGGTFGFPGLDRARPMHGYERHGFVDRPPPVSTAGLERPVAPAGFERPPLTGTWTR